MGSDSPVILSQPRKRHDLLAEIERIKTEIQVLASKLDLLDEIVQLDEGAAPKKNSQSASKISAKAEPPPVPLSAVGSAPPAPFPTAEQLMAGTDINNPELEELPYFELSLAPADRPKFKSMWRSTYGMEMFQGAEVIQQCNDKLHFAARYWQLKRAFEAALGKLEDKRDKGTLHPDFLSPPNFEAFRAIFRHANQRKLDRLREFFKIRWNDEIEYYSYAEPPPPPSSAGATLGVILVLGFLAAISRCG